MLATTMARLRRLTAVAGVVMSAAVPVFGQSTGSSTSPTQVRELERWSLSLGIDGRAPTGGHTYRTTTTVDGSGYEICTYAGFYQYGIGQLRR